MPNYEERQKFETELLMPGVYVDPMEMLRADIRQRLASSAGPATSQPALRLDPLDLSDVEPSAWQRAKARAGKFVRDPIQTLSDDWRRSSRLIEKEFGSGMRNLWQKATVVGPTAALTAMGGMAGRLLGLGTKAGAATGAGAGGAGAGTVATTAAETAAAAPPATGIGATISGAWKAIPGWLKAIGGFYLGKEMVKGTAGDIRAGIDYLATGKTQEERLTEKTQKAEKDLQEDKLKALLTERLLEQEAQERMIREENKRLGLTMQLKILEHQIQQDATAHAARTQILMDAMNRYDAVIQESDHERARLIRRAMGMEE